MTFHPQTESHAMHPSAYPYGGGVDDMSGMMYNPHHHPHHLQPQHHPHHPPPPPQHHLPHYDAGLQQEWNKLRVAQERLSLQQERMQIDKEIFEAERKNFRRSSKLKRCSVNGMELKRTASISGIRPPPIDPNPEDYKPHSPTRVTFAVSNHSSTSMNSDSSGPSLQEYQELKDKLEKTTAELNEQQTTKSTESDGKKMEELQKKLIAVERSLASIRVEKDLVTQERNDLLTQVEEANQKNTSMSQKQEEVDKAHKEEMDKLKSKVKTLKKTNTRHEAQREEVAIQHQAEIKTWTDTVAVLQEQKDAIREELLQAAKGENEETKTLQERIMEQANQLEDYKLKVSRGKLLLEEASAKVERLQMKSSDLEAKIDEQQSLIDGLQTSKEKWEQKADELEQELEDLKDKQDQQQQQQSERHFSICPSQRSNRSYDVSELSESIGDSQFTAIVSAIVIPMDENPLSSSLIRSGMRHVVEWEWTSREGVMGLYTGWLDVSGYPHGHGTWRIEDGSIYDGEWKRGLRDGTYWRCFFVFFLFFFVWMEEGKTSSPLIY